MSKRSRIGVFVVGGVILLGGLALAYKGRASAPRYTTAAVDRGDISDVVGATGLLQAVTTVQVGSQVSGTIQSLSADFNSNVKKGQIVARLDPSLFEARVAQANANLVSARAQVDRSSATILDARQKYERALALSKEDLLPASDLESAKATYDAATAQHMAEKAAVSQAEASVNQAQVDLGHTVIAAPIDGVVLARNVDVGQTVAASFTAPVLFVIANDLTQMQVNASIDEADIGRVKAGQDVTFRVDAYPEETFTGKVDQVRLQPVNTQNVVTYNTIITVPNSSQKLMPGMTATVSLIVQSRPDALRLPSTALRFRPEGFVEERRPASGPAATGAAPASPAAASAGPAVPGAPAPGPGGAGGERRRRRPEGQSAGQRGQGAGGRSALVFVPGPDGKPAPTRVRLGMSDGRFVEVLNGLEEGAQVITGAAEEGARPRPAGASPSPSNSNPFAPGRPQFRSR
jgi:HlyD family secretion protein